jgi:uncharacterized protein (DUF58 family)
MFVPRSRLIIGVGIVFLPASVAAVLFPWALWPSIGLITAFTLWALIDLGVSLDRFEGLQLELQDVLRISVGHRKNLTLRIKNERLLIRQLRVGIAFPDGLETQSRDIYTVLPENSPDSVVHWPVHGIRQGRYTLRHCYLETTSRLSMWSMRTAVNTPGEIRVYPDLMKERRKLSALFLKKGVGVHAQQQVGKGRDFEQLREYLPGDSYEDIHWKATAKRGEPITKVYQIERTQEIYLVIDSSRLSARNSGNGNSPDEQTKGPNKRRFESTILDHYKSAALITALAAERQGDLFGLLTFDDRVRSFIPAKSGVAHFNICRDALYTQTPRRVSPDFSELFTTIGTHVRRRALLIFLTHLDDPVLAEMFTQYIDLISRKHLVTVNMLKPVDANPLFSSDDVTMTDDLYRKLGEHLQWRHLMEIRMILRRHGIGFFLPDRDSLCTELISQYLNYKRRQLL